MRCGFQFAGLEYSIFGPYSLEASAPGLLTAEAALFLLPLRWRGGQECLN